LTSDEERLDGPTVTNRRRTVSAGPNLTDAFSPPVPYTEQSFEEVIFYFTFHVYKLYDSFCKFKI